MSDDRARAFGIVAHWCFDDPHVQELRSYYGFARFPPPAFTHRYKVAHEILRVLHISRMGIILSW